MPRQMNVISEMDLAFIVVATTLNKFDFYCIIDGERGLGKSTVGFRLAKNVTKIYRLLYKGDLEAIMKVFKLLKEENKNYMFSDFVLRLIYLKRMGAYIFRPKDDLIYDQESARKALDQWNSIAMFDEFVNIGYSRDFFDKGQKDLIKLINLNRDHTNLTIACIPHFLTADNQLRNLCKLRVYVHRRGEAVILSPNRGMSVRDRWDSDVNAKIETNWRKKGIKNPQWSKLTTFRAVMKTKPLTAAEEAEYQQIKNDKRTNLINKAESEETDPVKKGYEAIMDDLVRFKYKSYSEVNAAATALGVTPDTLRRNLKKMLREKGHYDDIKEYFLTKDKKKSIRKSIINKQTESMLDEMDGKSVIEARMKELDQELSPRQ